MPYVMVPVPAEHEAEFGEWLLAHTLRARLASWPPGAIQEVLDQADAVTRSLLAHLAEGAALYVPAEELAAAADLDVEEVVARFAALSDYCFARRWPALVMVKTEGAGTDTSPSTHSLLMGKDVRSTLRGLLAP